MKHRQWKKNYKKKYGYNPPSKRVQCKAIKQALVNMPDANKILDSLRNVAAAAFRAAGDASDHMGTMFKNVAYNLQPRDIKGRRLKWEADSVVCDSGVFEVDMLTGERKLLVITNRRSTAEKIVEILEQDHLESVELNHPERIIQVKGELACQ